MSSRDHHSDDIDTIYLPKLKTLELEGLPRLKSIYKGLMVCRSIEKVTVRICPMVRRLPLSLHIDSKQSTAPPSLKLITVEEEWWESLEWDDPLTKTILQPFLNTDDSEATPSDNRSEWEPSDEFEEEMSNPSSSADAASNVDTSAAVEHAIIIEIDGSASPSGEAEVPVPEEREDALRAIPDRTAPTLLSYRPTYRHFLKKKTKKRRGGNVADPSAKPSKKGKATAIPESERIVIEELPVEDLRGKERVPVDRISPDPFSAEPDMGPPKLDLAKILEEQAAKKKVAKAKPASSKTAVPEKSIPSGDLPKASVSSPSAQKRTTSRSKSTSEESRGQKGLGKK
ncbi:hypothetical protein Vadar_004882 [Vaccinium darrowii]|uniref:Uncharacterized protein n=1 Tax=Vaccinium darrowii TaxID=229202 RepID=A0ACB7WY96_9ERIC|nr:hypothetical protein Vadar_004882 [Vaccinium darrowii]